MTFTAIGTNNQSVWGVRKDAYKYTDKEILERAAGNLDADHPVTSKTTSDITLPTEGFNSSTITWSSSNTDIIANDGKVTRPETDTEVTLTATIKSGNETVTKTYKTTVLASSLIPDYKYDFESVSEKSVANSGKNSAAATLIGNAKVSKDNWYGNVLTIKNTKSDENYLSLPSDLFKNIDESGFTVGMWVKSIRKLQMKLHYLKQNHQRTVTAIHTRHSIQAFTQTLQAWKEQQKEVTRHHLSQADGVMLFIQSLKMVLKHILTVI